MLLRFLYRNLRGYRKFVVLAIVLTIAQVACDIGAAFPLKFIPSKVSNPGSDPTCTFPFLDPILKVFDTPLLDPSLNQPPFQPPLTQCPISPTDTSGVIVTSQHSVNGVIVFSVLMIVVFGFMSAILAFFDLFLATYIAQNLAARLRNQLFDHLQRLSLDWHGKQKKGDLVQRVVGNIADVQKLVTDGLVDLLAGVLTLAGVLSVMLFLSVPYTLISLSIAPVLFIAVLIYTKSIKLATKLTAKATGHVADVATEDINALTVIKVFTREERESLRFGSFVDTTRRAGLRAGTLQAQFTPIVSLLVVLGTATVLGVGGYVAADNAFHIGFFTIPPQSVDIGTLVLFLVFLKLLYQPMRDLSKLTTLTSSASSGMERIQEVLSQDPEVLESRAPYYGPTKLKGDIAFEHVVFGYVPDRPVLRDVSLHIPAGKKVALVGLSGGGKTTLVKLIPRFYEIQQGSVRIDGLDNRLYPLSVLRQNVSMVLQDSILFEGTIRDNIAVGKPGATDDEIIEAARRANIHEMIVADLGGYERHVREQGKDLSGGQRQRIAIARAMLRDAPILILDEPTAALDVEAESEVMHALDTLIEGRTVLMISHRLSTLGNVEEIVVLKDGHIVEQGSFNDLKRKGGVFAALLAEQNRYSKEKINEASMIRSAFVPLPAPVSAEEALRPHYLPAPSATVIKNRAQDGRGTPVVSSIAVPSHGDPRQPQTPGVNGAAKAKAPEYARIVVEVDGNVVGERVLDKPLLTVGRHTDSDVRVPSQVVSRLHARIIRENDAWVIEDADSLNGLIYHGHRVDRLTLTDGDSVYIAPAAVLRYTTTPASSA
ncbi:MAG TPA: ABC transporter transmembrane domain-containing protein [Ktedonobacterales bacterium]